MAAHSNKMVLPFVLVVYQMLLFAVPFLCSAEELEACKFDAIYQFGDSLSDTGNSIQEIPAAYHARLPYGQTIHRATGRSSDGLIMIDYIAQSAGLPLLEAYLNPNVTDFSTGVNFAVAGVTAMDKEELAKFNLAAPWTNSSLNVQLNWLDTHLHKICHDDPSYCSKKLKSSLFMVGEIGGNDYNYALASNFTTEKAKELAPHVVKVIIEGVEKVIRYGAVRIVVPGIFQYGCQPAYLTTHKGIIPGDYDELGCLKDLNELIEYHNNLLQQSIELLRKSNPNVIIVYGDLYKAMRWVFDNHSKFGISILNKSCCGIGGKYNFDPQKPCGAPGVPVCEDPNKYYSWDGGHWTQNFNKYASKWFINDIMPKLQCQNIQA